MSLEPVAQFEKILGESKSVLILLPQNPGGDEIGSAWACYFFLEKQGVAATVAFSDEFKEAKRFNFLATPTNLADNIYGSQDFVLVFNTRFNRILNVRTEKQEEELRIFITPEKGSIDPRDFSFIPSKFKYDLVVVLGASDKEALGKIYAESPDIFYEVPIVNIDCHSENDNFGQINIVNLTASSTAEVVAEALEKINPELIDATVAECLLTGIISATESFQKKNTTPRSLNLAAKLMERGADQQKISRFLYKTQPLNLLKLWGRVLVRLNWEEEMKLVWAAISLEDFVQSRTTPADLPFVLEKLKDNYSSGKTFLVLYSEAPEKVSGILRTSSEEVAKQYADLFKGAAKKDLVTFQLEGKLIEEAVRETLVQIKGQKSE